MNATRTPNPRGSGEQLRGELVAAARELLLAPRDVAPFSLRAVAKSVGVSPTAVYRHFDSAARLVEAVLEDQNDALREALGIADGTVADLPALVEIGVRYVRWGLVNPGGYQLLFESADRIEHVGGPGTPGWDMIESLSWWIGRLLDLEDEHDDRRDDGAAAILAIRVWSSLHGMTSLRLHKPGLTWPTEIETEVESVLRGLLSPPFGPEAR